MLYLILSGSLNNVLDWFSNFTGLFICSFLWLLCNKKESKTIVHLILINGQASWSSFWKNFQFLCVQFFILKLSLSNKILYHKSKRHLNFRLWNSFFPNLRSCDSTTNSSPSYFPWIQFPESQGFLVWGDLSFKKCDLKEAYVDFFAWNHKSSFVKVKSLEF